MEFPLQFSFFTILSESIKLLPRNGRLMVLISLVSVILNLGFLFLFSYSIQALSMDMLLSFQPNPNSSNSMHGDDPTDAASLSTPQLLSPRLKTDVAQMMLLEIVFIVAVYAVLILSTVSITLASAVSYCGNTLSIKDFCHALLRTWPRPLITFFFISGLTAGYVFVIAMLASPLMILNSRVTVALAIMLGISGFAFYLYLSVSWGLSMVISVVEEECYGARALGKASAIIKGRRLHGFLINTACYLMFLIIVQGVKLGFGSKWLLEHFYVYGLIVVVFGYSAKFLAVVAYTVLYFECKKIHGEEVEFNLGSFKYARLPITKEMAMGGDGH